MRHRRLRKIIACMGLASPLALCLSAGAAAAADCAKTTLDKLLIKSGHLIMATSATLPPMAYADKDGTLKGLRIDIGNEIAKRLCLTAEFVNTSYASMVPGLKGGRWDLIDAGLFVTPERLKILYMIPYETLAISISTRANDKAGITKIDDLAGKTVSVDIGGYDDKKLVELNADFKKRGLPEMRLNRFDDYATVYQALRAGQVDAAASIDPVAKQYEERGEFKQAVSGMFATPGSLAFVNKPLAEAVSGVLKAMKKDGSFEKLMSRYGVKPAPGDLDVLGPKG
jgi:polar amino acid transport system substrate-binding protein